MQGCHAFTFFLHAYLFYFECPFIFDFFIFVLDTDSIWYMREKWFLLPLWQKCPSYTIVRLAFYDKYIYWIDHI